MAKRIKTTKNSYGVEIQMCCASCEYKECDRGDNRLCMNGEGIVKPTSFCTGWKMAKTFEKVGKNDGGVKKSTYLRYVLERQIEEREMRDKGFKAAFTPLSELRKEWEKEHGSCYAIKPSEY